MSENIIEIHNLIKSFKNEEVLKGVNLNIKRGEIHGIIGKSGSGKSTLLRTINGLDAIDSGKILINGLDIQDLSDTEIRSQRKDIGMIFQNFALLNQKTVYENIALPLKCWGYKKEEIDKKVVELLTMVDLKDKMNSVPTQLSGGQRQRVAIARALVLEPKILLSDESTSGLDPITTNNILNLLLRINENLNITMIIVTHEMDVIKRICDKVSVLSDGKLLANGKVEDLFSEFNPYLMNYLEDIKFNIDNDRKIIKILIFNSVDDNSNFISNLKGKIEYKLEKGNIEKLKNGRLEEYYININVDDLEKCKNELDKLSNLNYKIVQ